MFIPDEQKLMINVLDYGVDNTGVSDVTPFIQNALNTAHNAGGGTVCIPYGSYLISSALVIYSNTNLLVDPNATITMSANGNTNLLKNACTIPSRTVTDAVTTATSATVTSATANFTAADVGKSVGILGAGPKSGLSSAPGALYGTIQTVNSSTSVVLSVAATSSTSGSTLNVYPARDSNISVVGGIWNRGNADSVYQSLASHAFLFRRIDRIYCAQSQQLSTGSQGIGGRYAYSFGDCTKVLVEKLDFNTVGDGIHFAGPCQYITVKDLTGTTGDDMVGFTGTDGQSQAASLLGDVNGSFSDILVENLHCNNAYTALRLSSGIGSNNVANTITRCKVKDIDGTVLNFGVGILDYAGNTTISCEVENVSVATGNNSALVYLSATNAQEIVLRGIKCPAITMPSNGVIEVANNVVTLIVRDCEYNTTSVVDGAFIQIFATSVANLIVDGIYTPFNNNCNLQIVQFNTAATTVNAIKISRVIKTISGGGNIVNVVAANYNFTQIDFSDCFYTNGSLFSASADSATSFNISASNISHDNASGALIIAQSPMTILLANVVHAQTGGAVRCNSAAATPVRIVGSNVKISGGSLFTRTASQSVSVNGLTLSCDISTLTPVDQDIVNNSNGALASGAGLCIFHTGGTGNGWKNIYSGATY